MSGYELLLEVIPRPSQPDIPVILLTQLAGTSLADMAKVYGAEAFLVKHAGNELVPVIRRAIGRVGPNEKDLQEDDQISD